MKKNIPLFISVMFCLHLGAHPIVMMPGYEHKMVDARAFENNDGGVQVQFMFSDENPVCNYVPISFTESNDGEMHRYFIPLNNMDEQNVEEIINKVTETTQSLGLDCRLSICDAPCLGVECLFVGQNGNLQVEKGVENNILFFTVSQVDKNVRQNDWRTRDIAREMISGNVMNSIEYQNR